MSGGTDRGLAVMQARFTIENMMHVYAERVDGGDMEGVGELFALGRVVMPDGSELVGSKAVRDGYVAAVLFYEADGEPASYRRHETTPRTRHMVVNHIFEFNNAVDVAVTRCAFTVMQIVAGQYQPIIGGRYHDEYFKDMAGWHFRTRQVLIDHVGDSSGHSARG